MTRACEQGVSADRGMTCTGLYVEPALRTEASGTLPDIDAASRELVRGGGGCHVEAESPPFKVGTRKGYEVYASGTDQLASRECAHSYSCVVRERDRLEVRVRVQAIQRPRFDMFYGSANRPRSGSPRSGGSRRRRAALLDALLSDRLE
jgi:hypothetical protein